MSIVWVGESDKVLQRENPCSKVITTDADVRLDIDSIRYLATVAFIEKVDEFCRLHVINSVHRKRISFESKWHSLDDISFIRNSGLGFHNDTFIIHSYDWSEEMPDDKDDDKGTNVDNPNKFNFVDIQTGATISWYKYVPRGLRVNRIMNALLSRDDGLKNMIDRIHSSLDA